MMSMGVFSQGATCYQTCPLIYNFIIIPSKQQYCLHILVYNEFSYVIFIITITKELFYDIIVQCPLHLSLKILTSYFSRKKYSPFCFCSLSLTESSLLMRGLKLSGSRRKVIFKLRKKEFIPVTRG